MAEFARSRIFFEDTVWDLRDVVGKVLFEVKWLWRNESRSRIRRDRVAKRLSKF